MKKNLLIIVIMILSLFQLAHAGSITMAANVVLRDPFKELSKEFSRLHPEHKVQITFLSSAEIYQQLQHNVPFDMVAVINTPALDQAIHDNFLRRDSRKIFATDQLALAYLNTSKQITLEEMRHQSNQPVISIPNPTLTHSGTIAISFLEAQGILQRERTELPKNILLAKDTQQSFNFIASGAAAVGFVYVSDIKTLEPSLTEIIVLPNKIEYAIASTTSSNDQLELEHQFTQFVLSPEGQAILMHYQMQPVIITH